MVSFFKAVGKGILYVLFFPFFLIALAIYTIVSIIGMITVLVSSIIRFFQGRNIFKEIPEDIEAKRRRDIERGLAKEEASTDLALATPQAPHTTIINVYQNTTPAEAPKAPSKEDDSTIEGEFSEAPQTALPELNIPAIEEIIPPQFPIEESEEIETKEDENKDEY